MPKTERLKKKPNKEMRHIRSMTTIRETPIVKKYPTNGAQSWGRGRHTSGIGETGPAIPVQRNLLNMTAEEKRRLDLNPPLCMTKQPFWETQACAKLPILRTKPPISQNTRNLKYRRTRSLWRHRIKAWGRNRDQDWRLQGVEEQCTTRMLSTSLSVGREGDRGGLRWI